MSNRETCLSLINTHGYISRNLLSRFLKISLQDSIKVLESVLPLASSIILYSTCLNNKLTIHSTKLSNSLIYAIGLNSFKQNFYDIEIKLKSFFYQSEDIAYPPSNVGIFIQEKRKVVLMDRVVKKLPLVTKGLVKKIEEKKVGIVENFGLKDSNVLERCGRGRQGCEKSRIEKDGGGGNGGFNGKMKGSNGVDRGLDGKGKEMIDVFEQMLIEGSKGVSRDVGLVKTQEKIAGKDVGVVLAKGKKIVGGLNDKGDDMVLENELKKSIGDDLSFKSGNKTLKKQDKDEINDILSNKNLYHTEEDEDYCSNTPNKMRNKLESSIAKDSSQDTLPLKHLIPANDYFKTNTPIKYKRKILKTRTRMENGKLITEDYSSEELIEIERPSNVLGKKQGVQQKINFSKRVDNN